MHSVATVATVAAPRRIDQHHADGGGPGAGRPPPRRCWPGALSRNCRSTTAVLTRIPATQNAPADSPEHGPTSPGQASREKAAPTTPGHRRRRGRQHGGLLVPSCLDCRSICQHWPAEVPPGKPARPRIGVIRKAPRCGSTAAGFRPGCGGRGIHARVAQSLPDPACGCALAMAPAPRWSAASMAPFAISSV